MDDFKPTLAKVADGVPLNAQEAEVAFKRLMTGEATPSQIGAFLMALRVRGETIDEIAAGASVMRSMAVRVTAPEGAIDTCGTGGDASGTYNISTAASFVVAACGVNIAKHGNRALSSKSGSSEVLEALGVKVDLEPQAITRCVEQAGIGFMMAPMHHSAMKHVGPTRAELGTRTIFNLLGPLSNPAGVSRQLVGVFAQQWVEPLAYALKKLGSEKVWIVHGSDGLDELTTTGPSHVAELRDGAISTFTIAPTDADLPLASPEDLKGGDATHNAKALRALLDGETSAYRDIVVLNSAAALIVAGKSDSLRTAANLAQTAIDSGGATARLEKLIDVSNSEN
jgi:anthranilate phosphoribosyltransferase